MPAGRSNPCFCQSLPEHQESETANTLERQHLPNLNASMSSIHICELKHRKIGICSIKLLRDFNPVFGSKWNQNPLLERIGDPPVSKKTRHEKSPCQPPTHCSWKTATDRYQRTARTQPSTRWNIAPAPSVQPGTTTRPRFRLDQSPATSGATLARSMNQISRLSLCCDDR